MYVLGDEGSGKSVFVQKILHKDKVRLVSYLARIVVLV